MNKQLILFVLVVCLVLGCIQLKVNKNASINFECNEYNFGDVKLNDDAQYSFIFFNPEDVPLIIQDVKTSCGCTISKWSKKPIKPRENDKIPIIYDTKYPGVFKKTITVFYNGENSPSTLIVKGRVLYSENINKN